MSDRSIKAIETGENGEQAVAGLLVEKGYHVIQDPLQDWDLLISESLTIEVKTAHLSKRIDRLAKRWQFCLYSHPERQQPVNEHLLILRCESNPPCHFIIPMVFVPKRLTKIDITSPDPWKYEGRWLIFRERWGLVKKLLEYHNRRKKTYENS